MKMTRPWLAPCAAAAVCWGSAAPAAEEPTDKQKREFETARSQSTCTPGSVNHPDYPFSVERLGRALKINRVLPQRTLPEPVQVLIVDNGFIGNRQRVSQDEGPSFVESDNYPRLFFRNLDQGFLPFLDPADAGVRPDDADPMRGHGTHISGIVLGGMYDKGDPKEGGANLVEPNVRRLLLDNPDVEQTRDAKPWLTMRFVPVGYGVGAAGTDPLSKLAEAVTKDAGASAQIVNMSLTRMLTSFPTPYALPDLREGMLVVLAAGNATMPLLPSVDALPARLEVNERLLIVASHDADGKLSEFSNYGDRVSLAAPGCQIKSWAEGDKPAIALSGTSMSTAVVTFAAALLRSQWESARGVGLRNRLLAAARYEPQLAKCPRARERTKIRTDPAECVGHGAMLDIAASIIVRRDLIEYEECPDDSGKRCTTLTAVGDLTSVPMPITSCISPPQQPIEYRGLTRNGAVKRIAAGNYLIASEVGHEPGRKELSWNACPVSAEGLSEPIRFKVNGLQLNSDTAPAPKTLEIKVSQLVRLVTRVK